MRKVRGACIKTKSEGEREMKTHLSLELARRAVTAYLHKLLVGDLEKRRRKEQNNGKKKRATPITYSEKKRSTTRRQSLCYCFLFLPPQ